MAFLDAAAEGYDGHPGDVAPTVLIDMPGPPLRNRRHGGLVLRPVSGVDDPPHVAAPAVPAGAASSRREAFRALEGRTLRQETAATGTPLRTATIASPRRGPGHGAEQLALHVFVREVEVIHPDDRVVADAAPPSIADVALDLETAELRLLSEERTTYRNDSADEALTLGTELGEAGYVLDGDDVFLASGRLRPGTQTVATFDPLGRVLTTSIRNGSDGDGEDEHSADFAYDTETLPASVHARVLRAYGGEDWEESWTYSDGGGTVVQTKVQAAPDGETARFIGTGRTVFDAKGNIVKQFEPFFSTTSAYEADSALTESGKAVHYAYDALGRNIRVTLPDGHTRTWSYTPWKVEFRDEEDNTSGGDHEDTPSTTHLDALGRAYTQVETPDGTAWHVTRVQLDVQGNVLAVIDPRGNTIQVQRFDLLGRPAFTGAADEGYDGSSGDGETRVLLDATGQPCRTWKSGGLALRTEYDALRRPVGLFVDEGSGERQVQATVFGDAVSDGPAHSLGRPVRQYDTAGEVRMSYDFRGRVVEQVRRVFEDIETEADWEGLLDEESLEDIDTWLTSNGALSAEEFTVSTEYDALDRVVEQVAPNGSVTAYSYDLGGKLLGIELDAAAVVDEILYNARGQRLSITYGNGTETSYEYDEDRFWLTRLLTMRSTEPLQDLTYTHDAVGNILAVEDDAQQTFYFSNTEVTPDQTFTYDSLYRLVEATGREKVGLSQTTYAPPASGDIPDGGDPALRTYTQSTTYDAAGNITQMHHVPSSGSNWTRNYTIHEDNNQLLATSIPGNSSAYDDEYSYNERGAMVFMPHLRSGVSENVVRDFRDQVRKVLLLNSGDEAWYATDAAGQRVRKVVRLGQYAHERIYVGGYEIYRKLNTVSEELEEEIQTVHVMDGEQRVLMAETRTVIDDEEVTSPVAVLRYQYSNHLGTATLECDEDGEIISYEEFHPYGTTSWWAQDTSIQVSLKRYRYTGMERDEETGMAYHHHRYYLPWLGRWASADPAGLVDGGNRFGYARGNPVGGRDPTGLTTGFERRLDANPTFAFDRDFAARTLNRAVGLAQTGTGLLEAHVGAIGIGAAPPALKPLFAFLLVHGADDASAGISTARSGELQPTLTNRGLTAAGEHVGVPNPQLTADIVEAVGSAGAAARAGRAALNQVAKPAGDSLARRVDDVAGGEFLDDGLRAADLQSPGIASHRAALLNELADAGVKHTPANVVGIERIGNRIVFLETGTSKAGLQHVVSEHGAQFAARGIAEDQIPDALFTALRTGTQVGAQGSRPIYEFTFNNTIQRIAITVGDNGYIVGANPAAI